MCVGYESREVWQLLAVSIFGDDGFDVVGRKFVFVALVDKEVRGVDKEGLVLAL